LGEGDQNALKTGLKGEGVKTAGLTDKNMLLIAMGLGMMASQKPGLSGAGEGALTGLKTVAPLLTKKASDFQIVEVADPKNPGKTKLVKINKRTNEQTDLGLAGKGGELPASYRSLALQADSMGIPLKSLLQFKYQKGKSKQDIILSMYNASMNSTIPPTPKEAMKMAEEGYSLLISTDKSVIDDLLSELE